MSANPYAQYKEAAPAETPYARFAKSSKSASEEGTNPYSKFTDREENSPNAPQEATDSGLLDEVGRIAKDSAVSLGHGITSAGEGLIGMVNIPTKGLAGKAAEAMGVDFEGVHSALDKQYSPEQQQVNKEVDEAEGFTDTAKAMVEHPSSIAHALVETAPSMALGGGVGALARKGAVKVAPRLMNKLNPATSATLAGAAGEGAVSAGQTAEEIRQQKDDFSVTDSLLATGAGLGTSIFGFIGGRIAQKLGFLDADTLVANLEIPDNIKKEGALGIVKRIVGGGISESTFEELPQSAQETIWQNAALDRPLLEDVPESAAKGIVVGAAMGGGANLLSPRSPQQDNVLKDGTFNSSQRASAANQVWQDLNKKDPELAEQWRVAAQESINTGQPLDVDQFLGGTSVTEESPGVVSKATRNLETETINVGEGENPYSQWAQDNQPNPETSDLEYGFADQANEAQDAEDIKYRQRKFEDLQSQQEIDRTPDLTSNESMGKWVDEQIGQSLEETGKKIDAEQSQNIVPGEQSVLAGTPESTTEQETANSQELLWKAGHEPNSASITTTPKPLTDDDKSPPLSGQSNSVTDNIAPVDSNVQAETTTTPEVNDAYAENRKIARSSKRDISRQVTRITDHLIRGADKIGGAISTRVKEISPRLEPQLRRLDLKIGTNSAKNVKAVEGMLRKAEKMTRSDYADWDYARKNGDAHKISELVAKYGMEKEYDSYRKTLDTIRQEALDVGLDVGYIEEYSPRIIKDTKGFLNAINKGDERSVVSEALAKRAKDLGISVSDMPPEMRADIISNTLYRGNMKSNPHGTKERKINNIPPELNRYYMHSDAALMQYIHSMRKNIEARRFFGKVPDKIRDTKTRLYKSLIQLDSLQKSDSPNQEKIAALEDNIAGYNEIIEQYKVQTDYSENIASYLDELRINGEIDEKQENELRDILTARFNERGTRGGWQAYKNFSYIDTMGSPISALTQIGDLAWSLYENGSMRTIKHASKAAIGKSQIKKEDVGIERIAQEFADPDTLSNAVAKVFKMVGLEKMDTIGKETMLNAAFEKYQDRAKKEPIKLSQEINYIFEKETEAVIQDLKNGNISENVLFLTYSKLLDYQPSALSEMSEQYLKAGNGRIFYMLKSYTLKQFDVYRREVYSKLKDGSGSEKIAAMKNMVRLSAFLVLANGGADEIKDYILRRPTAFSDRLTDNILRLFGINRFITWQARSEGVGTAVGKQILPPFKFINSAYQDIADLVDPSRTGASSGLRIAQSVPIAGKVYYWHYGRGKGAHLRLWEKRVSKLHRRLEKIEEKVTNNPELEPKHIDDLIKLDMVRDFRKELLKGKKEINKLKAEKQQGFDTGTMVDWLENTRADEIENYLNSL